MSQRGAQTLKKRLSKFLSREINATNGFDLYLLVFCCVKKMQIPILFPLAERLHNEAFLPALPHSALHPPTPSLANAAVRLFKEIHGYGLFRHRLVMYEPT